MHGSELLGYVPLPPCWCCVVFEVVVLFLCEVVVFFLCEPISSAVG